MKRNIFNYIRSGIMITMLLSSSIQLNAASMATVLESRVPAILGLLDKWFYNLIESNATYGTLARELKSIKQNFETTILCEIKTSDVLRCGTSVEKAFAQEVNSLLNTMFKIIENMDKKINSMYGCTNSQTFTKEFIQFKDKTLNDLEALIVRLRTIESNYSEPQKSQLNRITKIALALQNKYNNVNIAKVGLVRLPNLFQSMRKGK